MQANMRSNMKDEMDVNGECKHLRRLSTHWRGEPTRGSQTHTFGQTVFLKIQKLERKDINDRYVSPLRRSRPV